MAQCPGCQQQFQCGVEQHADTPCWCSALPPLLNLPQAGGAAAPQCYCPACLQRLWASRNYASPVPGNPL
ncbi:cysteine-rich CWC family protein [Paraherbaspirillum soli]|uniref:Cysteine-rich CWC family protein n=1 Tax=Paraherbaspirillum soli TaxID=631222 RepID=A0ABW0M6A5_9BURK